MTKVLYGWWTSILLIFQFFHSKHVFDLQSELDVVISAPLTSIWQPHVVKEKAILSRGVLPLCRKLFGKIYTTQVLPQAWELGPPF